MLAALAAVVTLAFPADIDPMALHRLVRRCSESQSWGLVVWHNGEPIVRRNFGHDPNATANLMSATKSITSIAVGMLLDEGKLKSVDTPLQSIFPNYKGKWKEQVTIRHLLEHTSGIRQYTDDPGRGDGFPPNRVASALETPIVVEPGTNFEYNNRAVDLLSGVVRRLAGVTLEEYLQKRLFEPLECSNVYWQSDPDGNPHGCAELFMRPDDMAKIGQLMLNGGVWKGKRLLSQEYIDAATTASKITEGKGEPCGWLWWICDPWFQLGDVFFNHLQKSGTDPSLIRKLQPLRDHRWPGYGEMTRDLIRLAGGSRVYDANISRFEGLEKYTENAPNAERNTGYIANGWGGQFILVLPSEHLVAVRTGGSGFFDTNDSSKYEMGDFYDLVRTLIVKPK